MPSESTKKLTLIIPLAILVFRPNFKKYLESKMPTVPPALDGIVGAGNMQKASEAAIIETDIASMRSKSKLIFPSL